MSYLSHPYWDGWPTSRDIKYTGFGGAAGEPWLKINPPAHVPAGGSTRFEYDESGMGIGFRTYGVDGEELSRYRWSDDVESFVLVIPKAE